MTPKEKAEELINKMYYTQSSPTSWNQAQQCTLIAVDEILNHHSQEQGLYRIDTYYWQEVKIELKKI